MYKATYKTSNLFSFKKYDFSNLNCQSYVYPTIYGIRCAILGAIITVDGVEKAKELFHNIKNSIIYVQFPNEYKINGIKLKRYSNKSYKINEEEKYDRDKLISSNFKTTMGFREYVDLKEIVFYIDKSIENIEIYLKNIDWIGTAESLVYLDKVEKVNKLENVMLSLNREYDVKVYEQFDWDSKIKFENVYMYSSELKHLHKKIKAYIGDLNI